MSRLRLEVCVWGGNCRGCVAVSSPAPARCVVSARCLCTSGVRWSLSRACALASPGLAAACRHAPATLPAWWRLCVQGLIAAFPKLVGTGQKQHTFVDTENCRWVARSSFASPPGVGQCNSPRALPCLPLLCLFAPLFVVMDDCCLEYGIRALAAAAVLHVCA